MLTVPALLLIVPLLLVPAPTPKTTQTVTNPAPRSATNKELFGPELPIVPGGQLDREVVVALADETTLDGGFWVNASVVVCPSLVFELVAVFETAAELEGIYDRVEREATLEL